MSFRDIDQLPTREERAAAFVERYERIESLERSKRRPSKEVLAHIEAQKQSLRCSAVGIPVMGVTKSPSRVAPVAEGAPSGIVRSRKQQQEKDR